MTKSTRIPPHALTLSLDRVFTALQVSLQDALASVALGPAQWDTLRLIRNNPGVSGADIARQLLVTPAAVTTMLQRLENANLIKRQASVKGRVIETRLTAQGEKALAAGDDLAKSVETILLKDFNPRERQQLYGYLQRCIKNLEPSVSVASSHRQHPRSEAKKS
jgi:DNA-binding MarR family transcriptional regulator